MGVGTELRDVLALSSSQLGAMSREPSVLPGSWRIESFYFCHCDMPCPIVIAHAGVSLWNVLPTQSSFLIRYKFPEKLFHMVIQADDPAAPWHPSCSLPNPKT